MQSVFKRAPTENFEQGTYKFLKYGGKIITEGPVSWVSYFYSIQILLPFLFKKIVENLKRYISDLNTIDQVKIGKTVIQ